MVKKETEILNVFNKFRRHTKVLGPCGVPVTNATLRFDIKIQKVYKVKRSESVLSTRE